MNEQTAPLTVPDELDTMKALESLIAGSPSAQREDIPQAVQVIPDKEFSGPARPDGATIAANDPLFTSPVPPAVSRPGPSVESPIPQNGPLLGAPTPNTTSPASADVGSGFMPAPVTANSNRIFFTGRTGVGKDWLAVQAKLKVLDINAPLLSWAQEHFPNAKMPDLISTLQTVKAWGNGIVDKNFPITPTRWMFIRWAQSLPWGPGAVAFGTPGFWMNLLVIAAAATDQPIAVTNVVLPADFKSLKDAGFTHFHVMTSPATYAARVKKPNQDDRMAIALDQDAIKKVSAQRQGERLPVIWNSTEQPPSPRLWTVTEWLGAMNAAPVEIAAFE